MSPLLILSPLRIPSRAPARAMRPRCSCLLSAGMGVRTGAGSPTVPPRVANLAATAADAEGAIDLMWDATLPATRTVSYTIDMSLTSGTGPWTHAKTVVKSSATVDNLTSGQRVWFRVAAVGVAGQGAWSDPATKIVP